jgi:hypothetical protein
LMFESVRRAIKKRNPPGVHAPMKAIKGGSHVAAVIGGNRITPSKLVAWHHGRPSDTPELRAPTMLTHPKHGEDQPVDRPVLARQWAATSRSVAAAGVSEWATPAPAPRGSRRAALRSGPGPSLRSP